MNSALGVLLFFLGLAVCVMSVKYPKKEHMLGTIGVITLAFGLMILAVEFFL